MKINPNYIANLKEKGKRSPKFEYGWQVLAHEMSDEKKFGIEMYFLFYKYPENKIREAYRKCSENGEYKMRHLIENIKGL